MAIVRPWLLCEALKTWHYSAGAITDLHIAWDHCLRPNSGPVLQWLWDYYPITTELSTPFDIIA